MVTSPLYPHVLQVKDGNGEWKDFSICDDQPNGKGSFIPDSGGSSYLFSSLIYLPPGKESILPGEDIRVLNGTSIRVKGSVARFSNDHFNRRIWL